MGTGGIRCSDAARAGVVPRLAHDLFHRSTSYDSMRVAVSVLEIYGEDLRDLLADGSHGKLRIREEPHGDMFVSGLTEVPVSSAQSLLRMLDQGATLRPVHCCQRGTVRTCSTM